MKKVGMTKGMLLAALIVGGAFNTAMAADKAATTEGMQGYELDQVVVTASRMENKKVDTPANVTVVDNEKIVSRGYRNVAEALEDVAGATVASYGTSVSEKAIRLNGDERVLVLVDGKRVNFNMGTTSNGSAKFDINLLPPMGTVERIEVVKGSAGAVYGSDAVGGVVNIITKKINNTNGSAYVGFGSNGGQEYGATYAAREGKTGVMVSAIRERTSQYKYKDIKSGDVKKLDNYKGYDNKKVSLKIDQDLNDDSKLGFSYDYSYNDGTSGSTSYLVPLNKKVNNLAFQYDWGLSGENLGFARVYRNYYGYDNNGDELSEVTLGLDLQQETKINEKNKIVYGASIKEGKAYNKINYSGDSSINNKAIFVQDQWQFAPSWQLNAGARYDNHSKAGSKTTMSAAVNKKFNEDSNAYLSWGQVFNAPSMDDMFTYNPLWGMYGDPNLKPETGDVWTIGYNVNTSKATTLGVSAFYSQLEDAIKWQKKAGTYEYYATNIYKQKKRGFELTANHKLNDNFDLEASYTYAKVKNDKNDSNGYQIDSNVIPNMYRFGVRYHNDLWNVDLVGRGGSGASAASYADNHYLTMDINAKYKVTKDLSAYLKLYNLNNAAYTENASVTDGTYDYPMQSRRFMMGMEYKF